METIKIYTIGFTKKTARLFFESLQTNGVKRVIDVRLHSHSHLAGFTRAEHMEYFCEQAGISYTSCPDLAPPEELMVRYRSGKVSFDDYKKEYLTAIEGREVLKKYTVEDFADAALLCCENEPDGCHRKILAEYIKENSSETVDIVHL